MKKKKLAYVNFHPMPWVIDPEFKWNVYYQSFDYLFLLTDHFDVQVFDRIGIDYKFEKKGITINYFKSNSKSKLALPIGFIRSLKAWNPDIVYIQGMGFPHYLLCLRFSLLASTKFVIRDHADKLPRWYYHWHYKWANTYVHTYFFTSKVLAKPWIDNNIIARDKPIIPCVEGSTRFKNASEITKDKDTFLWVGRLDKNKDPLTVLKAFKAYTAYNHNAKLKLVFEDTTLLPQVENFISETSLTNYVELLGKVDHQALERQYQKAAFFILGSHKEGGPFSLIEAMACGCIPIVTAIPAFKTMTNNGACGFLFNSGDVAHLTQVLKDLDRHNLPLMREKILLWFEKELSTSSISNKIKDAFLMC